MLMLTSLVVFTSENLKKTKTENKHDRNLKISIDQSINQSIGQSINQSINHSCNQ